MLGGASFQTVVRDKREELMRTILSQVNRKRASLAFEIVDVRIKRVDLPEANMQAIYRRMQTERQREAAELRAEGEGAARRIRATADRQVTVIKADATGESERIRGDGDAERNRIYAEAYNQDPEFFGFYRSMQAYEKGLQAGDTRLLLTPDSEFFKYFNDASGRTPPPAPRPVSIPRRRPSPSPRLRRRRQPPAEPEPRAAASGEAGRTTPPPQ